MNKVFVWIHHEENLNCRVNKGKEKPLIFVTNKYTFVYIIATALWTTETEVGVFSYGVFSYLL